jgi:hypothetical protein
MASQVQQTSHDDGIWGRHTGRTSSGMEIEMLGLDALHLVIRKTIMHKLHKKYIMEKFSLFVCMCSFTYFISKLFH